MKRKSLWLWLAVMLLGAALLVAAGCGGDGGGDATGTGDGPAATEGQPGGTLKFMLNTDTDYNDPALAYYQISWQIEYATCLKLLNFPDEEGDAGGEIIPEAAEAMPEVSADGLTYTFTIKDGFKFSPPSTETVTADTFAFVINRDLNPEMQSPSTGFISDIEGAEQVIAGDAKEATGVTADGNTLTIKLTKVAPDFLSRITMPFFCAIPTDTPVNPKGERTVPSAGPYYIDSWTPSRALTVKKNPNYTGDREALVDQIDYEIGVDLDQGALQVKQGQLDYMADGPPPAQMAQLIQQYGEDSPAAAEGKQQLFLTPILAVRYIAINNARQPFDNVKLRQAINFAIDRPAIIRTRGAGSGEPSDQILPPLMLGYKDEDVYPLDGPDLEQAQALMDESGVQTPLKAVLYTANTSPGPEQAQVIQQNLGEIGIEVSIKQYERAVQFTKTGTKGEPFDMSVEGWFADYPDPFDFVNVLLDGDNIQESGNVNFAYFDDPAFNKKMDDAAVLEGDERYATYGDLDIEITRDGAPWASYMNDLQQDFFSARVGCQSFHPVYSMSLAKLCLRN
jgi:peptide/nickel transport system substrate-binding protein